MNRDTDRQGQLHRQTGTVTHRRTGKLETVRQGQGQKRTETGTQTVRDRATNGQGKGHKRTWTGISTWTWTTLTNNFKKNKSAESVNFHKILQNWILSADALFKFKNKRSSVKLTFLKRKISAVPFINGSTDNGLINGQRKLCPALVTSCSYTLQKIRNMGDYYILNLWMIRDFS